MITNTMAPKTNVVNSQLQYYLYEIFELFILTFLNNVSLLSFYIFVFQFHKIAHKCIIMILDYYPKYVYMVCMFDDHVFEHSQECCFY